MVIQTARPRTNDLSAALDPRYLSVDGDFYVRCGIGSVASRMTLFLDGTSLSTK